MYTLRAIAFIVSLLLVLGAVAPTHGWLIALTVLTGLSLLGSRPLVPRFYFRARRWADEWW